jgi:osmotically-inducible protein OsmY
LRQDDADLRLQVEAALATLLPSNITVNVHDGNARLRGIVISEQHRDEAERVVRNVPGIRDVQADLTVGQVGHDATATGEPSTTPDEESLERLFARRDTAVDLTEAVGTTDSQIAAEEAIPYSPPTDPVVRPADRAEAQGIEIVGGFAESSLDDDEATSGSPRGDDDIAEAVRQALQADAGTTDLRIQVRVRSGVVMLRGQVETIDDTENAEEVAARVPGVVSVVEELEVRSLQ